MVTMTEAESIRAALRESVDAVRARSTLQPDIAVILGTGLGALADEIEVQAAIPYSDIPHFPLSTVESHTGRLLLGNLCGQRVVTMQGRFHRYEGYDLRQIVHPVRTMFLLGAKTLVVSNVSGGMHPLWQA